MSVSSLELCVLASGSGGNCSLVRVPGNGVMLLDIGIGPRTFVKRLAAVDVPTPVLLEDVSAVCLTHLDSDHVNLNWLATLQRLGVRVYCHASRLDELAERVWDRGFSVDLRPFDESEVFEPLDGLSVRSIAFDHDATGSHGFLIDGYGGRIGYATDLGSVPDALLERFCDLDFLAIESNYDRQMQLDSDRPWFLKQRVMSGAGHLSNAEAFEAVRELFDRCEGRGATLPRHVVLLHRSRECNCPELLRKLFSRDRRIAPRLILSEQHEPTPWLRTGPVPGEQLKLNWSVCGDARSTPQLAT